MEEYSLKEHKSRRQRQLLWGSLLIVLFLGWLTEVVLINRMYDKLTVRRGYELYGMDEKVYFEKNMYTAKQYAEGCSIIVTDAYLKDYDQLIQDIGITVSENKWSERRVLIIEVTLTAEENDLDFFSVNELECRGNDSRMLQDWILLSQMNPSLDENLRLSLKKGETQQLELPFVLYKKYMEKAWDKMENYPLYFRVTVAMVKKEIMLSLSDVPK